MISNNIDVVSQGKVSLIQIHAAEAWLREGQYSVVLYGHHS